MSEPPLESEKPGAQRRGTYKRRYGLVLPKLGRKHTTIYINAVSFRRELERLVGGRQGGLGLLQYARIQSVVRAEESVRMLELATRDDQDIRPDRLVVIRNAIADWSTKRDSLLAELLGNGSGKAGGGTSCGSDPWAQLDATQAKPRRLSSPATPQPAPKADCTQDGSPAVQPADNARTDATNDVSRCEIVNLTEAGPDV